MGDPRAGSPDGIPLRERWLEGVPETEAAWPSEFADRLHEADELIRQLRAALSSRQVIGQATGLVMALLECDSQHAFAVLCQHSQVSNTKLHRVAHDLVDDHDTAHPSAPEPGAKSEALIREIGARPGRVEPPHQTGDGLSTARETEAGAAGPNHDMPGPRGQVPHD